jgi:hypothetical protein
VVERYGVDNEDAFPPIKVVVVEGSEDITIKISDEGGGIPRSAIPLIWTSVEEFLRTFASALPLRSFDLASSFSPFSPCLSWDRAGKGETREGFIQSYPSSGLDHHPQPKEFEPSRKAEPDTKHQEQELKRVDDRYLYTTMSDEGLEANIESSDFKAPMAGFG